MADAEAVANDSWFDDVTKCIPASASNQQKAEVKEDFEINDEVFFNEPSKVPVAGDAGDDSYAKRGFYDTDIVMIEAKHDGTVRLGSGVLMKDMKSWIAAVSENEEKRYRFVITAAHVVCSAQWEQVEIYNCIRVRIPLKPWPEFPENWAKYQGGYKERTDFFSNIIVKREHIFVHPNYEGKWYDVAMIAIPEVIATQDARGFKWWNSGKPTAFAVVGFPMATKNDGETASHIPYVSARKHNKNGIAKIEFKKMKTMMAKYYCFTRSGMSGGAIILDGCIAGIHNRKDELEQNCGHGLIFDSEVKKWMSSVAGKWDVDLGIHDNSAERLTLHGRGDLSGMGAAASAFASATSGSQWQNDSHAKNKDQFSRGKAGLEDREQEEEANASSGLFSGAFSGLGMFSYGLGAAAVAFDGGAAAATVAGVAAGAGAGATMMGPIIAGGAVAAGVGYAATYALSSPKITSGLTMEEHMEKTLKHKVTKKAKKAALLSMDQEKLRQLKQKYKYDIDINNLS